MQTPIVIDIEASGFGKGSYPIEVGVALQSGKTFCTLVKPEQGWTHWDNEAERCHGLSRELLLKCGRPVEDVATALNELLADKTVYTDAWSHDGSWLDLLFDSAGQARMFRLETLRALISDEQLNYWQATKTEVVDSSHLRRHRASADALILQSTFQRSLLKALRLA